MWFGRLGSYSLTADIFSGKGVNSLSVSFFDIPFHGHYVVNAVIHLAALFCVFAYYRWDYK